jgi:dephospho-CoA kinase
MYSRVALTGGIGAGKSTIAHHLEGRGAYVIDYDEVSRDVVVPGSDGLRRLHDLFGDEALNADGTLNRRWLAQEMFHRDDLRDRVNRTLHPLIFAEAEKRETDWLTRHHISANFGAGKGSGSRYWREGGLRAIVLHEISLLAETGTQSWFDAIVDVEAPEDMRIRRLVETRGMSVSDAQERIAAQAGEEERRAIATYVIDSSGTLEETLRQADEIFDLLQRR